MLWQEITTLSTIYAHIYSYYCNSSFFFAIIFLKKVSLFAVIDQSLFVSFGQKRTFPPPTQRVDFDSPISRWFSFLFVFSFSFYFIFVDRWSSWRVLLDPLLFLFFCFDHLLWEIALHADNKSSNILHKPHRYMLRQSFYSFEVRIGLWCSSCLCCHI